MRTGRGQSYIAVVRDGKGDTYEYVFFSVARRRRDAEDEARESARESGGTLVEITPVLEHGTGPTVRRLIAVAAVTFAVSSIAIAAAMVIGLTLGGPL